MEIQSLSVHVPTGKCPNACKFCVSQMHPSPYENLIGQDYANQAQHEHHYMRRLEFARDNGCNTLILTGDGEPLSNRAFLNTFAKLNWAMKSSFRWIEVQTSGVYLDDNMLQFLAGTVGVSTISLSLSSLDTGKNAKFNMTPDKLMFTVEGMCESIKKAGFNLRLSLNMNDTFDIIPLNDLFKSLKALGADQVTFRRLYTSGKASPQDNWIRNHEYESFGALNTYIQKYGRPLERLPFGAMRYSVDGISTLVDDDCMSGEVKESIKYLILRPNCKLYTKWDDEGSLLF